MKPRNQRPVLSPREPYRHRRLAKPRADVFVGAQVRGEIAIAGVEIDDIEPAERLRLALLSFTANFRGLQSWRDRLDALAVDRFDHRPQIIGNRERGVSEDRTRRSPHHS